MKQPPDNGKNTTLSTQSQSMNGDEITNGSSSIIEFLNQEQKCLHPSDNDLNSELDVDSIFEEINRLSDESDERSVDEILREAELLLSKQKQIESDLNRSQHDDKKSDDDSTESNGLTDNINLYKWHFDDHLDTISEKTTPRNTKSHSSDSRDEPTLQTTDDLEFDEHVSKTKCVFFVFFIMFVCLFYNKLMWDWLHVVPSTFYNTHFSLGKPFRHLRQMHSRKHKCYCFKVFLLLLLLLFLHSI